MNCPMMSVGSAPTALRMPISLVRSSTEISMMFITPMPPTSSEIPATEPSSTASVPLAADPTAPTAEARAIEKSLCPSGTWWRWSRTLVTSCLAAGSASEEVGATAIASTGPIPGWMYPCR